jgi:hypothetical protein
MTVEMTAEELAIERQQIEEVFRLGGGELASKPWEPFVPCESSDEDLQWSLRVLGGLSADASERTTLPYWYEGVPEWAGRSEFPHEHETGYDYRTVISCELYGRSPETLMDRGVLWTRVASYTSGGETECPLAQAEEEEWAEDLFAARPCKLCEAQEGEEHGCIYLGDGWSEVVYESRTRYCDSCSEEIPVVGPCLCEYCATEE